MTSSRTTMTRSRIILLTTTGVAASSASGLIFEIALTRVFAVTQFYHFAFLAVSMALLGLGAGGSALTAFPRIGMGGPRRWAWLAALQGVATIGAYTVTNHLPFDSFAIAWDRTQLVYLAVYYIVPAVPFFFGGLVVGALLTGVDQPVSMPPGLIYGAAMIGSGLGCVTAVVGLNVVGAEGTVVLAAIVAVAGAGGFAALVERRRRLVDGLVATFVVMVGVVVVAPGLFVMNLSPYKALSAALRFPGAAVVDTRWDHGTRIDLVRSDGIRSFPGLSLTFTGSPPPQDGVTFDGDDLSPVPRIDPGHAAFASHMLNALAWRLRPDADTLVLEPGGGLDVLIALAEGAGTVTVAEPHGAVFGMVGRLGESPYNDPRVTVVVDDPRTFVQRTEERYDIVDLALTAQYRPVTSGAYSLAENYTITVEAFNAYLQRLAPGGIVTAMRWTQTPPSEEMKMLAVAARSLRNADIEPADAVVMLRSYSNTVLLVAPGGWSAADLAAVRAFADDERFDLVAMPGLDPSETNRYNVIPDESCAAFAAELLSTDDPSALFTASEFDITPPTDDHPFFGHYFRWDQTTRIIDSLGRTWQPFGGAGYLVLVAFLILAIVASAVLIVVPIAVRRPDAATRVPVALGWWTFGYFAALGMAFLFVEIPLIQTFILLVGHPATAFALVLFAVLVTSGLGSVASPRMPWFAVAVALTIVAAASPLLVRTVTAVALPAPLPIRAVAAVAVIAPLGFLMGTMFPRGVAYLRDRSPRLVPRAWGINGTVSVVAAIVAALLALAFGFTTVLRAGAVAYAVVAVLAFSADRSVIGAGERHEHH